MGGGEIGYRNLRKGRQNKYDRSRRPGNPRRKYGEGFGTRGFRKRQALRIPKKNNCRIGGKQIVKKLEETIYIKEKLNRYEAMNKLKEEWLERCEEEYKDTPKNIADSLFEDAINDIVHKKDSCITKFPRRFPLAK